MGRLPLEFVNHETPEPLGLTGFEKYEVDLKEVKVNGKMNVKTSTGKTFVTKVRIDT